MQRVGALHLSLHLHNQTHFKQRIEPLDKGVRMLTLDIDKTNVRGFNDDEENGHVQAAEKTIRKMEKIQLKHPAGKKAIRMDSDKYEALRNVILNHLKKNHEATHTEMVHAITEDFKKNKIKFEGSIEWHMEWVKLDLEARKEIKRSEAASPIKFSLA